MPAIFVHLSDIHFGQERDERVHIHDDVKQQLIIDAADMVKTLPGAAAHGILVTGDIAFSGIQPQYAAAGAWLDDLAHAIGCEIFRIQMVPGNHDLDRAKLSLGAGHVLDVIRDGGATEYEKILANDLDRASLFARFEEFGRFCEAYDCPLDLEGRYSTNLHVELAPGRAIRFVRMNSSLLCTGEETDAEPELMVGARQFTVARTAGEETIVLIHHPLNWFKDNEDATRYLKSRVRVLISGHEHDPKVHVEPVEAGSDLLMLAAGATVPFKSNDTYTFTYNIIEFDWDPDEDALAVTIHPRAWDAEHTRFEADEKRLGGKSLPFVLGSPNFRRGVPVKVEAALAAETPQPHEDTEPIVEVVAALDSEGEPAVPPEAEGYRLVLLRFFRDLAEGERLKILVELGAVDSDSDERMTQAVERQLLDWLVREGRVTEVESMIAALISNRREGESG
jgi:GTPase-associated adaptor domain/Calcineurin-like phosphoesterase